MGLLKHARVPLSGLLTATSHGTCLQMHPTLDTLLLRRWWR